MKFPTVLEVKYRKDGTPDAWRRKWLVQWTGTNDVIGQRWFPTKKKAWREAKAITKTLRKHGKMFYGKDFFKMVEAVA